MLPRLNPDNRPVNECKSSKRDENPGLETFLTNTTNDGVN
jgi:hypothetical protein